MKTKIPEKAALLEKLTAGGFSVPPFIYVTPEDFKKQRFDQLAEFLGKNCDGYKVIARSAHPMEEQYKSGTFDSFGTYADVGGIQYARKKMIRMATTTKRLSIQRQQHFNRAPAIDLGQMGVVVMPFIEGTAVMAKEISDQWEFGYCRDRTRKLQKEPFITRIPHDRRLLQLSKEIQAHLGFRCEIEYIVSARGDIFVVQAKDISHIEILAEKKVGDRSVRLDGLRRVRKRRNYRERPLYVIDNKKFYIHLISQCEDLLQDGEGAKPGIADLLQTIRNYQLEMENFALKHQRFAVLGLSIQDAEDLFQIASHYLDEKPEQRAELAAALHNNLYEIDNFIAEADTMIAKDKLRINLGSHDAYGIDTVRNPLWSVYWFMEKHETMVKTFQRLGFKTGDTIGIEVDVDNIPTIYRL